jgi:predicted metalloprotease
MKEEKIEMNSRRQEKEVEDEEEDGEVDMEEEEEEDKEEQEVQERSKSQLEAEELARRWKETVSYGKKLEEKKLEEKVSNGHGSGSASLAQEDTAVVYQDTSAQDTSAPRQDSGEPGYSRGKQRVRGESIQ